MKKCIVLVLLIFSVAAVQAQTVFGEWTTFNDDSGNPNSIIEIYNKEDGKVYGKVVRIIKKEERGRRCNNCDGKLKDQPIEGLELLRGLEKNGKEYSNGLITDPKTGKEYKCKIWLDEKDPNKLHIRGYIAFFYRTQTWERVK